MISIAASTDVSGVTLTSAFGSSSKSVITSRTVVSSFTRPLATARR
jgi:hypothetical protein